MERKELSSNTDWEEKVGYSRAVLVNNRVVLSGTTATNENNEIVGVDDPYLQTKKALENIESAIGSFGGEMDDIIRTRMYVTDIDNWDKIGEAHSDIFDESKPATSMVEVSRLVNPKMLVEIEAEAILE